MGWSHWNLGAARSLHAQRPLPQPDSRCILTASIRSQDFVGFQVFHVDVACQARSLGHVTGCVLQGQSHRQAGRAEAGDELGMGWERTCESGPWRPEGHRHRGWRRQRSGRGTRRWPESHECLQYPTGQHAPSSHTGCVVTSVTRSFVWWHLCCVNYSGILQPSLRGYQHGMVQSTVCKSV